MIDHILLIIMKLLLGWLIADLCGGLLHWIEDRVLRDDDTWLGRHVVAPNRRHHVDPVAFTRDGFLSRNGTTWAAVGIIGLFWLVAFGPSTILLGALLGGAVTSMVHYLTHVPPPLGHPLRVLQEIGIIQSVAQHAQHHRAPGDRRYCVLTDWLNPLLDGIGLWTALERILVRAGVVIDPAAGPEKAQ